MSSRIQTIKALEVRDSRGNPTLRTLVQLQSGQMGVACVPCGASTGKNAAVELRDEDALGGAATYG